MAAQLNFKVTKAIIAKARGAAYREAKSVWPFVRGRDGALLCTASADGNQCEPAVAAECPVWDGTKASIEALVTKVRDQYPDVALVYIEGAYDGAERLDDFRDQYEPRVEEWEVQIWSRADGYLHG
jgi:hypothetical protein